MVVEDHWPEGGLGDAVLAALAGSGLERPNVVKLGVKEVGPVLADTPLRSGPPVGARNDRSGFVPRFVTGPTAGKRLCPV